jgi:hypothetical protein
MDNSLKTSEAKAESTMTVNLAGGVEVLKFCNNGDIYLRGKLIENDKQVVDGFREFLALGKREEVNIKNIENE